MWTLVALPHTELSCAAAVPSYTRAIVLPPSPRLPLSARMPSVALLARTLWLLLQRHHTSCTATSPTPPLSMSNPHSWHSPRPRSFVFSFRWVGNVLFFPFVRAISALVVSPPLLMCSGPSAQPRPPASLFPARVLKPPERAPHRPPTSTSPTSRTQEKAPLLLLLRVFLVRLCGLVCLLLFACARACTRVCGDGVAPLPAGLACLSLRASRTSGLWHLRRFAGEGRAEDSPVGGEQLRGRGAHWMGRRGDAFHGALCRVARPPRAHTHTPSMHRQRGFFGFAAISRPPDGGVRVLFSAFVCVCGRVPLFPSPLLRTGFGIHPRREGECA
eukprot:RCo028549